MAGARRAAAEHHPGHHDDAYGLSLARHLRRRGALRWRPVHAVQSEQPTGFGNALVYSILERRNGELWFATYGGGVSRFADGRFTQLTTREGLSSDYTTCLSEDRAGTLWIATDGGGVDRYHDGRFTPFTMEHGLPSNLVRGLVEDDEGGMLVGTSRGIARIADGRVTTYPVAQVASLDIRTLARAADGSLWVAGMTGGLYRVQARVVTDVGPRHRLTNNVVESLYAGADGVVWVGTTGAPVSLR